MIKISFNNGASLASTLKGKIQEAMETGIQKTLNEKLKHLMPEILQEKGKFVVENSGPSRISVNPKGFSKDLTERINQALK